MILDTFDAVLIFILNTFLTIVDLTEAYVNNVLTAFPL